jgi:H+-translocating NAD(P) transhydrogenase subunit beta
VTAPTAVPKPTSTATSSAEHVADLLLSATSVAIVPGYGLGVAQAQKELRELTALLGARGIAVYFVVHPVAGRMPGHMNVLLDDAGVAFARLEELDAANTRLATTTVALVVGANDIVNPGAQTSSTSPIAGMAIVEVARAEHVVALLRSLQPGFARLDNALWHHPRTTVVLGDAKTTLEAIAAEIRAREH